MRILMTILAATLLVSPLTPSAQAKDVSVEFFYDSLDPYGEWIQTADYGFVFHPKDVAEDWRPYTDGSWAYTDAGWTWVSEEPFGGITYHYGRWTRLQDAGWVWVPDTEWAPAWVSWRRSEQYVGWAPLPPEATFKRDVGISTWSDSYYDIGPSQYSFVAARDFGAPRLTKVVLPRRQNTTIITETRNITNITYTSGVIYNDGPEYTVISRESREPVRRLRLERRDDVVFEGHRVRNEGLRATIAGDSLRVFAPAVSFRTEARPEHIGRRVERVEVDRGWRDVAQSQELRTRIQQDTPRAPAALPQKPAFTRATAALGLSDNASRKANLDADGKPRTERAGRSTAAGATPETGRTPATTTTENTKPGDRPRTGAEAIRPGDRPAPTGTEVPPNGRKPATAEVKPGKGRPESATTEPAPGAPRTTREGNDPAAPDAPRTGKPGAPKMAPGTKPAATDRPEAAPESREGKPGAPRTGTEPGNTPDAPRSGKGGPNATAPGANPSTTRPEGREGKPGSKEPTREGVKPSTTTRSEGVPEAREDKPEAPRGNKEPRPESARPESSKPESARPGAERGGKNEPKAAAPGPDNAERGRKEGAKPEANRPDGDRPGAERGGNKEPKAAAPSGEPARPRTEGRAPEAPRRPEGAAPASRPGAPAGAPATEVKGKKGDKDGDKDKDKGKRD